MKIGVIHYRIGEEGLEQLFSWCKENKVNYVELQRKDVWEGDKIKIGEVKSLIEKYGVKVSQISCGNDFVQKTEEEFENQVKLVSEMMKIVKEIGSNQLRIDGGREKEGVDEKNYKKLIMEGIKRVVEVAEKEKVYLALDNHGTLTNDYLFQIEIFESIKSDFLGANLDTMNYRWFGYPVEKLPEIYKTIAPFTIHTHIKDGTGTRENYKGKVLGEGEIPLLEAIKILKDNNYNGVWCVEYEGDKGEEGYRRSVIWLKENLQTFAQK